MYVGASPVSPQRAEAPVATPRRLGLLIIRDLTLKGVVVGSRRMLGDMLRQMVAHDVRPVIDRVYDFSAANEALAYAAGWNKIGKVVIRLAGPTPACPEPARATPARPLIRRPS